MLVQEILKMSRNLHILGHHITTQVKMSVTSNIIAAANLGIMKKGWRVQSYLISIANNISTNNMYREMDVSFSWAHVNSIESVHLYLLCSKICCQLKITLYNQSLIRCSITGSTRCVFHILKFNRLFIHNWNGVVMLCLL